MNRTRLSLIVLPLLIAGCATPVDDPDNPSIRGKWVKSMRFVSHRLNGASVDSEVLGDIPKDPPPEEFCGEVAFRDGDVWKRTFETGLKSTCKIESHDVSGNRLSAKLKCIMPREGENDHDIIIHAKGSIGPKHTRIDAEMVSRMTVPTGETHRLTSDIVVEARWLGDC